MGEAKRIEIHYVFGGKPHLIQASEDEAIHLPDIGEQGYCSLITNSTLFDLT